MSNRVGEEYKLSNEVISISSATTGLSCGYSMDDCNEVTFVVGMGTALSAATAITPTITVRQSGDSLLSTNATIGGLTATLGPTTAEVLNNVKKALITMTTAATGAQTVTVNGVVWTFSTAPETTSLTFGSAAGSTNAEGLEQSMNTLSSGINASTVAALQGLTATTGSTANVSIRVNDTASTSLSLTGVAGAYGLTSEKSQVIFSVLESDLNSTSKFVGIQIGTAVTAVTLAVCAIQKGMRYKEPFQVAGSNLKST
jgi:hypothetical protein